jgi:hypothetical protein
MKRPLCCLALLLTSYVLPAQVAPPHKPVAALPPTELIKLLPSAPTGWEMKESKASSFYNEWLVSQANRQFLGPKNPPGSPSGAPAPPPMTRLRLTDTGYTSALIGDFEEFKPGKYGNTESLYFNSLPARRMTFADGERIRVLVKGRFVVEVETHNQAPNAVTSWLGQFDFPRINSIPDSGAEKLPNPVTVASIDELNPKANGSYQVSWSTQADLDAARKRKP